MTLGPGLFVAIVGPSGAGKDSLIRALAERYPAGDIVVVRRVVTRASDAHEDHDTMDLETFERTERAGGFALAWGAHGLRYGLPATIDADIAAGRLVIANLSRGAVAAARARWPRVFAALVTASAETLAARLAARGREDAEARRGRLERALAPEAPLVADATISNDGDLAEAVQRLYEWVRSQT